MFEIKNNCSYFSFYLFRKLNEIIVENVSITLFRVTTEWLLIFSTLYSPTITILACFIRKKKQNCLGVQPRVHQGIALLDEVGENLKWKRNIYKKILIVKHQTKTEGKFSILCQFWLNFTVHIKIFWLFITQSFLEVHNVITQFQIISGYNY